MDKEKVEVLTHPMNKMPDNHQLITGIFSLANHED
jgi:hypothetical protein